MKKFTFALLLLFTASTFLFATPGDTTTIQTFTFAEGRKHHIGTFEFPNSDKQYERILMYYTLKCDPSMNPACGEWDYIFWTELLEPTDTLTDQNGADSVIYHPWNLATYITPYGNNLDLKSGWTWVFDVTDFTPLLKGQVTLQDGNYQELLDLKFVFIEGTPAREVKRIENIYQGPYQLSNFDSSIVETLVTLQDGETMAKVRATVTGHDYNNPTNCAEFCAKTHSFKVNGQQTESWPIIEPCADNPLYPQGGTWLNARAGWCPGKPGTTRFFELTPYIHNDSVTFDYDIQSDPYGFYRTTIHVVKYGDIANQNDARAEGIITPTDDRLQSRFNPACGNPVVKITNIGSENLTNAVIEYGFINGKTYSYEWEGNLKFDETDTVVLPTPNYNEATGNGNNVFWFNILSPNGVDDPSPHNNYLSSTFTLPTIVSKDNTFEFYFKTNESPNETKWQIINVATGEVLYQNPTSMAVGTAYPTEFTLEPGSYKVSLFDTEDDGLYYWYYAALVQQGYATGIGLFGMAILRGKPKSSSIYRTIHNFEPEFGRFAQWSFAVEQFADSTVQGSHPETSNIAEETGRKQLSIFPNPATTHIIIDLSDIYEKDLKATFIDATGRVALTKAVPRMSVPKVDVSTLSKGIYSIVITSGNKTVARSKLVKQ
ncbi:MAG: T9SS type A sorting domain-containing protein [Bacteroidales bacterium]|jgi:hypothetical protein|nr:T9SS type A sorting domain-containing protein [Bacteroidales bacterium]